MSDGRDKLLEIGLAWDAAVKRLDDGQGRITRNNARQAALKALRDMRRELDKAFPVIAKKKRQRQRVALCDAKDPAALKSKRRWAKYHSMRDAGYRQMRTRKTIVCLVGAGVPNRKGPGLIASGMGLTQEDVLWFPTWALAANTPSEMRQAKRSHNKREELRALFLIEEAQK